jgi:septal ring factor EnvC (AmiA/AmiB activator)
MSNLDPSNFCSCGQPPTLVTTHHDELSDESASDLSLSINSLLSLDIQDFALFREQKSHPDNQEKTTLDITMSQTEEKISKQQEIIDTQGQRIEELLKMIQEMKDETESKINKLIQIVSKLTTHQAHNDSKRKIMQRAVGHQ